MDKTQYTWAMEQLLDTGRVSRNDALRNYISRLGAIIFNLKEAGFEIEGRYVKTDYGRDYIYELVS